MPCPGEDEECGEKRFCRDCHRRYLDRVSSLQETEKWGGYEEPLKKKVKQSYYLNTKFLREDFENYGNQKAKIFLKNSNLINSKTFTVEGIKYSLVFTYAFDSICQVMLKSLQNPELRNVLSSWHTDFSDFLILLKLTNPGKIYTDFKLIVSYIIYSSYMPIFFTAFIIKYDILEERKFEFHMLIFVLGIKHHIYPVQ